MKKNSLFTGLVLGAIVPVLGFLFVEFFFDILIKMDLMDYVSSTGPSRRQRTMALLAICCSLIPFHVAKRNYWNETMRGVVFPTLIYVVLWVWHYKDSLFL